MYVDITPHVFPFRMRGTRKTFNLRKAHIKKAESLVAFCLYGIADRKWS